jgi:outer membrane protein assembly factor BamB
LAPLLKTGPSFSVPIAMACIEDRPWRRPGRLAARAWCGGKPVGQGFAGPVVVQGRVIVFHRMGNNEIVDALDAKTGASQWRYQYPTTYRDDFGFDEGPRSVPVVSNGVVYTYGAEGQLHAVDLATGQRVWSVDAMRQFGVPKGFFGLPARRSSRTAACWPTSADRRLA